MALRLFYVVFLVVFRTVNAGVWVVGAKSASGGREVRESKKFLGAGVTRWRRRGGGAQGGGSGPGQCLPACTVQQSSPASQQAADTWQAAGISEALP